MGVVPGLVLFWAVIWGGAKRMGGGKRSREHALPKIFGPLQKSFRSALSWIFIQEKQSTDTWERWKTYHTRGGPKTIFQIGGVSFVLRSSSPATGVIWALRAQSRKKVRKWVPGASRPRGSKKSKKSPKEWVQNPFLGGVSFVRFSTPLLFPPPHGVWILGEFLPKPYIL